MSLWMNIMQLIIGRLDQMSNHFPKPTFEDIPLLDLALSDEKVPVRRKRLYY